MINHNILPIQVGVAAMVEKTTDVVKETMQAATYPAIELKVPLVVDAGVGDDWATAH